MEAVAATLYCLDIAFLLSFQFLNRDYPPFAQPVSNYGVGSTATLFRFYVVAGSIAAPLLAWQFWMARDPVYPALIPVYLLLVMAGRLAIGLYPNDLRGGPRTRAGQIHHAATLVAFTCGYMVVVEATPQLAPTATGLLPAALFGLKHLISFGFLAVVLTMSAPLRPFFGLAERVFLYAAALWCLTASLTLPPL